MTNLYKLLLPVFLDSILYNWKCSTMPAFIIHILFWHIFPYENHSLTVNCYLAYGIFLVPWLQDYMSKIKDIFKRKKKQFKKSNE